MTRKIEEMHRRFGVLQDKRCEDCSNLIKGRYHGMNLRKCTVYGATHSEASDWRKKYIACGLFNTEWHGTEIIRTLKRSGMPKVPEEPLDGQMDMLGEPSIANNVYDQCEVHENCTVEVWSNSETGETSIGWWENE